MIHVRKISLVLWMGFLFLPCDARKVRVGLYQNPPKVFMDSSGKASGIFIDLLEAIAHERDWKLEYTPHEWSECLADLQAGRIDLMPDVAITPDRNEIFDFHQIPILDSWSQIYAKLGTPIIHYSDLKDRRVAILGGSLQEEGFQIMMAGFGIPFQIVSIKNYEDGFRMVQNDSADVVIANYFVGEYLFHRYGLNRTSIVFQPSALFFATKQGKNTELLKVIDQHMEKWEREPNSIYFKTLSHWMAPPPKSIIPRYMLWTVGVIGVFLLVAGIGLFLMRGSLKNRYKEIAQVFQAMPEAMVYADLERRVTKVNPAFERIFGYSASEVIGKTTSILYASPSAFLEQGEKRFNLHAQASFDPYEVSYRRKNGEEFLGETVGSVIRDHDEHPMGMLALIRDVSHFRKLEAQLIQAQKMESVGRLAGGVAHDFNNILGVLLGYAEMALQKVGPSDPLHDYLTEILKGTKRSRDITKQLLTFARKQTISPVVLDLNATIESMMKMLSRLIGEDIILQWQPSRDLWRVIMDSSQIDQLLANLCVNARDAIQNVGTLTIRTSNVPEEVIQTMEHREAPVMDYVCISVEDTGCGMDSQTLGQIFEPFFTTKGQGKGTGLGLSTVYGIVQQNNGFLHVNSELGIGTKFQIYIPRHHAELSETIAPTQELLKARGEGILVVEDDPALLEVTVRILKMNGYSVLAAKTPEMAMQLAEESVLKADLLLTDVVMPGMNGKDLAARLLAKYPKMRCLFMSGYTADVIAFRGALDNKVLFLQKPFSMQDLCAKVREALS